MILHIAQIHRRYAAQQLDQLFVALGDGCAEFVTVHIVIIEQADNVGFGWRALCRCFNVAEDAFQRFVQVFVIRCAIQHIPKQFARQDKEALFLYKPIPCAFGFFVA